MCIVYVYMYLCMCVCMCVYVCIRGSRCHFVAQASTISDIVILTY